MDVLQAIFRWFHILAGIIWIGHLYFFNFVNGPYQGVIDAETKKKSNPELLPRALFWFRWGAAWTWITGILLLLLVYYPGWRGGLMFEDGSSISSTTAPASRRPATSRAKRARWSSLARFHTGVRVATRRGACLSAEICGLMVQRECAR